MSSVTISKYRNKLIQRLINCMFILAVAWKVFYSRRLNKLKLSQERSSDFLIFTRTVKTYVHQSICFYRVMPLFAKSQLFVTTLTPRILSSLSAIHNDESNRHPPPT